MAASSRSSGVGGNRPRSSSPSKCRQEASSAAEHFLGLERDLNNLQLDLPVERIEKPDIERLEDCSDAFHDVAEKLKWFVVEVKNVRTTSDTAAIEAIAAAEVTVANIKKSKDALSRVVLGNRFNYKRSIFSDVKAKREGAEKELTELLRNVSANIQTLQNLVSSIVPRGITHHPEDPLAAILGQHLNAIPVRDRASLQLGTLSLLWENIDLCPALEEATKGVALADGHAYREKEDIRRTERVLRAFQATCNNLWLNSSHLPRSLQTLHLYRDICIILKHTGYSKALDCFLRRNWSDESLVFSVDQLSDIETEIRLPGFAEAFVGEQYRIKPRVWPDDPAEVVHLHDKEPLPFKHCKDAGQGDFGNVSTVQEIVSKGFFVLKLPRGDSLLEQDHFLNEIARLNGLQNCKHVVKLKHCFKRGERIGIVLQKGDESLDILLRRYHRDDFLPKEGTGVRAWIKDPLLQAFGCLSRGMEYVHTSKVRHKDIKPANIVHVSNGRQDHNFFWIDFGVAFYYGNDVNSHDRPQLRHSRRWAAPEILENEPVTPDKSSGRRQLTSREQRLLDELDPTIYPQVDNIGRSADIYSLGITFLEVLSVMVGEPYSPASLNQVALVSSQDHRRTFESCTPFHRHIPQIEQWIHAQLKRIADDSRLADLKLVFKACLTMIKHDPKERYTAGGVVSLLAASSERSKYFCAECLDDLKKEAAEKASTLNRKDLRSKTDPSRFTTSRTTSQESIDKDGAAERRQAEHIQAFLQGDPLSAPPPPLRLPTRKNTSPL